MAETFRVRDAYLSLNEDTWRLSNEFSADIALAHDVLLNPFAAPADKAKMLACWLQKPRSADGPGHQPCLFGRIAAKSAMHYCILDENVLVDSDQEIREELHQALRQWKQRSIDPDLSDPAHGFMVLLSARRIAEASPDDRLLSLGVLTPRSVST